MPQFGPFESDRPLIVYVDIKSPYAFVAKDPTRDLATSLGIRVDWRPLTLDIPSYAGSARLDAEGKVVESHRSQAQWSGIKYAYKDARRYAALRGLTLRGTTKIWDTSIVHIGFQWAKEHSDDVLARYLDDVYVRFWRREFDAENPEVVADALKQAGASTVGFDAYLAGPGREFHDHTQAEVFEAGIFGVPGYVVEGEYYFGREHLPRIGWILGGRRGPAPDIAYRRMPAS